MTLFAILLLPFIGSICVALLHSNARNTAAWTASAFSLASAGLVVALYPQAVGGVLHASLPWLPQFGLEF